MLMKTAVLFRIQSYEEADWRMPQSSALEQSMAESPFTPCGPTQTVSGGWVAPRGKNGALAKFVGGQLIVRHATETRAVPASAVKARLEERCAQIKDETGREPKGRAKRELKEEVIQELLPRAFTKRSDVTIWVDPKARMVVVGTSSTKKADAVLTQLCDLFMAAGDGLPLKALSANTAPSTAMSQWLRDHVAPYGFTVDRECELRDGDGERATVRYTRHNLDIDEVAEHIRQGKLATQLAMTWGGRVSLVLTESMALKRLELLNQEKTKSAPGDGAEDHFDADVALFTGEMALVIPDLINALDGELGVDPAPETGGEATASDAASRESRESRESEVVEV